FVMELVPGLKITEYCDQHQLPAKERLQLFQRVCHAVQHAHQKGIIHRDLKPSNILVTAHDGVPVPKIIDFGVAKAVAQRLTEKTLFTAFTQLIGTPAYMSPEQATLASEDIDTRSDIYSLGVLLYELLTSRPPFEPDTLLRAGLDEMRRILREVDPPKPSTRLTTLANDDLARIARFRQSEPPKLLSLVRGDLDWIVMKCLDKDRNRRYSRASELADELKRWQRHEPIQARPISAWSRAMKLARRRPAFVIGLGAAAVVLAGAAVALNSWRMVSRNHRVLLEVTRREALRAAEKYQLRMVEEQLHTPHASSSALAQLAYFAQRFPTNSAVAMRLAFELGQRRFLVPERIYRVPEEVPNGGAFSRDGTQLLAVLDRSIQIWETATGRKTVRLTHPGVGTVRAQWSSDGRRVLSYTTLLAADRRGWMLARGADGGVHAHTHDHTVRLWDAGTGDELVCFRGHEAELTFAAFSPDGRRILSASKHGDVCIWSIDDPAHAVRTTGHQREVVFAEWSPDGGEVLTCGSDEQALIWDSATGACRLKLPMPGHRAALGRFTPDGNHIVTACCEVQVWSRGDGTLLHTVTVDQKPVVDMDIAPDGETFLTAGCTNTVQIRRLPTGETLAVLQLEDDPVQARFSPDGRFILTASHNGSLCLWDARTGQAHSECYTPADPERTYDQLGRTRYAVNAIDWHPAPSRFLTAGNDGAVVIWKVPPSASPWLRWEIEDPVQAAALSPTGNLVVASTGQDFRWIKFSAEHQGPEVSMLDQTDIAHVQFADQGRLLLTLRKDGLIQIWNCETRQPMGPPLTTAGATLARLSQDSSRVLSIGGRTLQVWDARSGMKLGEVQNEGSAFTHAEFGTNAQQLMTVDGAGTVKLWHFAEDTSPSARQLKRDWASRSAIFSPQGDSVLIRRGDRAVVVFRLDRRYPEKEVSHFRPITAAGFLPDSMMLFTASLDGTASLWNGLSGAAQGESLQHPDAVLAGASAAGGHRLTTLCADGILRVWDLTSGSVVAEFSGHTVPANALELDHTGSRLLISGSGGLKIYRLPLMPSRVPAWMTTFVESLCGSPVGDAQDSRGLERLLELRPQLRLEATINDWAALAVQVIEAVPPGAKPLPMLRLESSR
ncbi:MAG: protein kinase, partial [Verrucomicrobia bacterium]|nr:protein kinase [Verrucomicrobiota bacterium]